MEHRVDRMLSEPLHRRLVLKTPQHAACVRRGDDKVDLHWCVHGRYARRLGGTRLWSERRVVDVGVPLPALSTENALLALVIAIAEDLRRACVRAKLFLDLYLACRALSAELDWDAWLSRLRGDGLERLSANVFALLLDLWGCATELPSLADAVARRAELIETTTPDEALDLVSRATSDPANKLWFRRIHSATPLRRAVFRWSADLPHTLARTAGLRRTRLALWPTPRTA
jgi:hypothetical protein